MQNQIKAEWNHIVWGEPPLSVKCKTCGKEFTPEKWEWRNRLMIDHSAHLLWDVCSRCRYVVASRYALEKQGKL